MTSLLETLNGLKEDPTLVLQLYQQLFGENYFAIIRPGTENDLDKMEFLIYDTPDEVRELPLFTSEHFVLYDLAKNASVIQIGGQSFWERLLDIIETGKCEVAINPLQPHSIRLTKEMILGMIGNYGAK
ncbi:MAG: hypothetical protein JWN83_155 [Chitinophagaceae bacterium]|nr:hypothetical protein [Chitinophagaceae bacterium]